MSLLTSPFKASGTTLGYKLTSAGSTYTSLGELVDLDFGGIAVASIETSSLASTAKTSIPSIPDCGEVTFTVYYVPGDTGVAELQTLALAPAIAYWQVQVPDGTSSSTGSTLSFAGYVTSFAPSGFAVDATPTASVTIKITGLIAFAAGT